MALRPGCNVPQDVRVHWPLDRVANLLQPKEGGEGGEGKGWGEKRAEGVRPGAADRPPRWVVRHPRARPS